MPQRKRKISECNERKCERIRIQEQQNSNEMSLWLRHEQEHANFIRLFAFIQYLQRKFQETTKVYSEEKEEREALNINFYRPLGAFFQELPHEAKIRIPENSGQHASYCYDQTFTLMIMNVRVADGKNCLYFVNFKSFYSLLIPKFVQNNAFTRALLRFRNDYVLAWKDEDCKEFFDETQTKQFVTDLWQPLDKVYVWELHFKKEATIRPKTIGSSLLYLDPYINCIGSDGKTIWECLPSLNETHRDQIIDILLSREDIDLSVMIENTRTLPDFLTCKFRGPDLAHRMVASRYHDLRRALLQFFDLFFSDMPTPLRALIVSYLYQL